MALLMYVQCKVTKYTEHKITQILSMIKTKKARCLFSSLFWPLLFEVSIVFRQLGPGQWKNKNSLQHSISFGVILWHDLPAQKCVATTLFSHIKKSKGIQKCLENIGLLTHYQSISALNMIFPFPMFVCNFSFWRDGANEILCSDNDSTSFRFSSFLFISFAVLGGWLTSNEQISK